MLKVFRWLVAALVLSCALLTTRNALATHFRYGNITYTIPNPANPRTVRFEVTTAWRSTFIGATTLNFGDGISNPNTTGLEIGTGIDAAGLQYTFQRYTVTHTYPAAGPNQYTAYFTSCCRISNLINGGDDSFRVETKVDLTAGNTGNPISFIPAIIQLQTNGVRTQFIPAIDPDGVPVSCRFSTPAEAGDLTTVMPPVIPGGAAPTIAVNANPPGCVITWDTANALGGQQYAVSVTLESYNGPALTSATVDYIIEMVTPPPPTCAGSGSFDIDVGTPFSTMVTGTKIGGGTLTLNAVWQNGVITPSPPSNGASPMDATLSWTPTQFEVGVNLATITFTDAQKLTGYCTLVMNVPPCPQYGQACSAGVGACLSPGILQCDMGSVICTAQAGQPTPEICDGIDNNCDGTVDDGNPESNQACTTTLPGLCSTGLSDCVSGTLECIPDVQPGTVTETCDGVDQDCDGTIDNGFGLGMPCTVGVGGCANSGTVICDAGGNSVCSAVAGQPSAEICDGVDNDCNGTVDEGFQLGMSCTVGVGACEATGVLVCGGAGMAVCSVSPGMPTAEICGNNVDENCDGALNDGCVDTDGDGLYDQQEQAIGTNPNDSDSDDDGVLDADEPSYDQDTDGDGLINALDPDSDNDGLFDGTELGLGCGDPGTDVDKGHCVADADQGATVTDPLDPDTDGSGATDGSEDFNLNGTVDSGEADPTAGGDDSTVEDSDADGLGDQLELALHANPNDADSDDDGVSDGLEANPSDDTDGDRLVNVIDVDSDDDGLLDGTEVGANCAGTGTDATKGRCKADADNGATTTSMVSADSDRGSVRDGSEDANLDGKVDAGEGDPVDRDDDTSVADGDGDRLSDALEATLGSDPADADSDDDGLLDGDEHNPSVDMDDDGAVCAVDSDCDGDGLFDGLEAGLGCANMDTDASAEACTADGDSGATTTSTVNADTDFGGAVDGDEDANANGVVDADERDPNDPTDDDNVPTGCTSDADCGTPTSGAICLDDGTCGAGCRGTGGNSCPASRVCTSTDDTPGECVRPPPVTAPPADSGCGCRVAGSDMNGAGLWLAGAAAALVLARRRRRRSGAGR